MNLLVIQLPKHIPAWRSRQDHSDRCPYDSLTILPCVGVSESEKNHFSPIKNGKISFFPYFILKHIKGHDLTISVLIVIFFLTFETTFCLKTWKIGHNICCTENWTPKMGQIIRQFSTSPSKTHYFLFEIYIEGRKKSFSSNFTRTN